MNKREIIACIAGEMNITYVEAKKFVDCHIHIMATVLQSGEEISYNGFGSLVTLRQTERLGRNPKSGEPIMIRPRITARFKPGKKLLEMLNIKKKKTPK